MPAVLCISVTQIIQIHSSKTTCAHLAFENWEFRPCPQSREGLRSSTRGLCQHHTCSQKLTKCTTNPQVWKWNIYAVNWTAWQKDGVAPGGVSGCLQCPGYLQTCYGEPLVGVTKVAQQPPPPVHGTLSVYTIFGLKDCFFLHVQKAPVSFSMLPRADQQLRAWCGVAHTQQEAGPGHRLLRRQPGIAGASPGTFDTHRLRSLSFMSPVGFATVYRV